LLTSEGTKKKEAAPATPKSASTPLKEPMRKQLPNGLIVEDLVIGNGAPAQVGRKVFTVMFFYFVY
jgi:FKBP-type peptidyl-prolyl cis-trans isomerase